MHFCGFRGPDGIKVHPRGLHSLRNHFNENCSTGHLKLGPEFEIAMFYIWDVQIKSVIFY